MPEPLRSIGVVMPPDFPSAAHDAIQEAVTVSLTNEHPAWVEFQGGWRAVAYRFRGCALNSERFTASVAAHGPGPPHETRADQEDDLFGFFTSGLACLESFGYAMHAIGSALDGATFPMATENEKRAVEIRSTCQRFESRFGEEQLPQALRETLDADEYDEWRSVRNVLAHREAPLRHHAIGTGVTRAGSAGSGRVIPGGQTTWHARGIPLNTDTTPTRRAWLVTQLEALLAAADAFVAEHP